MTTSITIQSAGQKIGEGDTVIIVPDIAVQEAGYIQTLSSKNSGHAKHDYQALAQMAYFQYQDDELVIREVAGPLLITYGSEQIELKGGLVLWRGPSGTLQVQGTGEQSRKKLLEAGYRYCTRWVRLDI